MALLVLLAAAQRGLHPESALAGSEEREMVRRYSVLLPPSKKSNQSGDVQFHLPTVDGITPEVFSNLEPDRTYSSDDLKWPFEFLSNVGEFTTESTWHEILPPNPSLHLD